MSTGKRKDARFDLRLSSELVDRLQSWIDERPLVRSKTQALEIALEKLLENNEEDCPWLNETERRIIDDYRRPLDPIPTRRKILSDLIKSLK